MSESTYSGIHSGHGCNVLRHSAPFKLRFINAVDLKDLGHCHSSFWEAEGQKNPFDVLTTFSILNVFQVKQAMVGPTRGMV